MYFKKIIVGQMSVQCIVHSAKCPSAKCAKAFCRPSVSLLYIRFRTNNEHYIIIYFLNYYKFNNFVYQLRLFTQ